MIKVKTVALGALVGVALALAPMSSAFADQRFHGGHWGHGDRGHGWRVWPLFGLTAAVVGTAAAIVAAPFEILADVVNAPYYRPPSGYAPAPVMYNNAPAAYYPAPADQTYYGPPSAPTYNRSTARAYNNQASAPTYYRPPDRTYYHSAPPGYYDARQTYDTPSRSQYGVPPDYYEQQSYAPRYEYRR